MTMEEKIANIDRIGRQYIDALRHVARLEGLLREIQTQPVEVGEAAQAAAQERAVRREAASKACIPPASATMLPDTGAPAPTAEQVTAALRSGIVRRGPGGPAWMLGLLRKYGAKSMSDLDIAAHGAAVISEAEAVD
jgi:hypothetical protein